MKTHTTPAGKEIALPSTADDFELYSSMPGSETAATELYTALAAIADEIEPFAVQGYAPTPKKIRELFDARIEPVLDRHVDVGAGDSEPAHNCRTALDRIASIIGGARPRP